MLWFFEIQNDSTILDIPAKNSIINWSIMAALSLMCRHRHVFAAASMCSPPPGSDSWRFAQLLPSKLFSLIFLFLSGNLFPLLPMKTKCWCKFASTAFGLKIAWVTDWFENRIFFKPHPLTYTDILKVKQAKKITFSRILS